MQGFRVSHIFYEGNSGADLMANRGCELDFFTLWECDFPPDLAALAARDLLFVFKRL